MSYEDLNKVLRESPPETITWFLRAGMKEGISSLISSNFEKLDFQPRSMYNVYRIRSMLTRYSKSHYRCYDSNVKYCEQHSTCTIGLRTYQLSDQFTHPMCRICSFLRFYRFSTISGWETTKESRL